MARRLKRRETEIFSISFLDCITCGLGSVVLLLVLSDVRSPEAEQSRQEAEAQLVKLQDELVDITGQSEILNRDLKARQEQLSDEQAKIARLRGDLSDIRGQYAASKQEADVANQIEGRLVSAQQSLTEEMKRVLGKGFHRKKDDAIGGIPVDSEYIIFVVDTSGSMVNYGWQMLIEKVQETLNLYPKVKGFQIMDDEGGYMFSGYKGKWIPDTPAQRKIVVDRIRNWNAFSNSSPIEGIVEAIRTYYSKDKKISIYVFGDEFTGSSIDAVVKSVDVLNREDKTGERRVRIHAIGFPVRPDAPQYTSIRFATLMRILCAKNGGSFVGLHDPERRGTQFRIGDAEAVPGDAPVRPALQSDGQQPQQGAAEDASPVPQRATGHVTGHVTGLVTGRGTKPSAAPRGNDTIDLATDPPAKLSLTAPAAPRPS